MEMEYKGFRIVTADFSMKKIVQLGKGDVPSELKGSYTSPAEAMKVIDNYKPKRGAKQNVKTVSTTDV